MCRYQYESEGHMSFGDNIPDSCQGAYFHGDEPGTYCRETGAPCTPALGECPLWEPYGLCPECMRGSLYVGGPDGAVECANMTCGEKWASRRHLRQWIFGWLHAVRGSHYSVRNFVTMKLAEALDGIWHPFCGITMEEFSEAIGAPQSQITDTLRRVRQE